MFIIEAAGPGDLPALAKLAAETLPERYDPTFFLTMFEHARDTFLVARDLGDMRAIGFALATRASTAEARLLMLAVAERHRDHGIGARLLLDAERRLRNVGVREMALEVREDNVRGIGFYRRHGYDIRGAVPHYYQDGSRAVLMSKGL